MYADEEVIIRAFLEWVNDASNPYLLLKYLSEDANLLDPVSTDEALAAYEKSAR